MTPEESRRGRLARVTANLESMGLEQLFVCDPTSVGWLTGFCVEPGERLFGLMVKVGADPVLLVNDLFPTPADLPVQTLGFRDTDDSVGILASVCDPSKTLGCDKNMPARFLLPLRDRGAAAGFVLGSAAVDDARSIKDDYELDLMRAASKTNDEAMAWLKSQVREGVTERQIADGLMAFYRSRGAEAFSFSPIVSFGAHAADPHHEPDDTPLVGPDVVLFDVGCVQNGYCSDMTRTFFWKDVTPKQREVYNLVLAANAAAAATVRPGVPFCEIDLAGRRIIEAAGYGAEFNHRLGHSIGMNDHEPGDVSQTNTDPIAAGMCFSDEPGIYLAGEFGVRIEDLIVVTPDGGEVINHYPRELEVLGV